MKKIKIMWFIPIFGNVIVGESYRSWSEIIIFTAISLPKLSRGFVSAMRNAGFTTFCGLDSLLRSVRCEDKNPQEARKFLPSFLLSPISLTILVLAKFFQPTLLPFSLPFITSVPVVGIVLLSSQTLHMGPGNQAQWKSTLFILVQCDIITILNRVLNCLNLLLLSHNYLWFKNNWIYHCCTLKCNKWYFTYKHCW